MVVMVISMIIYALLPFDSFNAKFLGRIALLPLITGLSYELIRFAAKRQGTIMGLLTAPGLWLQRITTKPPDDTEVAVAIHALEGAMTLEARQGGELVGKYREWKVASRNLAEARTMLAETDPELRTMAADEVARLEPEITRIED